MIELIAATSIDERIADFSGKIPWKSKSDMIRFRKLTIGCPIIMGYNTFRSLGKKPLERRFNIVMTRNPRVFTNPVTGVCFVNSVDEALQVAAKMRVQLNSPNIMVIGGTEIYSQFISFCNRIHITEFDMKIGMGIYSINIPKPMFNEDESKRVHVSAGEGEDYDSVYKVLNTNH